MKREWRVVPDWPEYEVSDFGEVRNAIRRPGTQLGRLLRPRKRAKSGHLSVTLTRNAISYPKQVHQLVARAFIGDPPSPEHEVAHGDGVATNNRVTNLRWATHAENQMDRVLHGTSNRGVQNAHAKLTPSKVKRIRRLAPVALQREIAALFGVHQSAIHYVLDGKTWSHVQ